MRIAFAWWGTGWHVFPVQSLIKYLFKFYSTQYDVFWLGEKPSLERETYQNLAADFLVDDAHMRTSLPSQKGATRNPIFRAFLFLRIFSGKRRREKEFFAIVLNVFGLFLLLVGIFQSMFYLLRRKIDKVFCKWWYVSLPVVIAARILRKPILLHESDTKPWLANRICSKFATTIFTWFENVFPDKEIVVGQILDDDLVGEITAINKHDITDVLVIGWSQGSQSLYEAFYEMLYSNQNAFAYTRFHVILGTQNLSFMDRFAKFDFVYVYSFVDQKTMGNLLVKCDVAITRGGTTSLAEQEIFGIKKIIIPIPRTHDQLKNAQYYQKTYWDVLIEQWDSDFKEIFEKTVLDYSHYLKQPYSNPLEGIRKTKETIVGYLIQ